MSSIRFFQALPVEQSVQHLDSLSLRNLIRVWLSGREMHPIINANKALLKRLGAASFEEFLDRINSLSKCNARDRSQLEKLYDMVVDDGLQSKPLNYYRNPLN